LTHKDRGDSYEGSRDTQEPLDQRGIHPTVNIASPPLYIEGKPYLWRKPPIATKIIQLAAAKEGDKLLKISTMEKEEEGARSLRP
jgi:hypothetical protein